MMKQELTYWFTLAMIPKIWTKRKNEIYVKCYNHVPRLSIIQLFDDSTIWNELGLSEDEMSLFYEARAQLANNSFLVEELLAQGYNIIPIDSFDYPRTLKHNLKAGAPSVIFTKGNVQLLQKDSTAIVGSRNAGDMSLLFAKNVSQDQVEKGKVVVSGFAKGVDRQALDAAIEKNGESIIVLPQGITTFSAGYKLYYRYIVQGKVLVMSTFHPKARWSVELAMARNPIIYGMANDIYVAQSDDKGGTWSGVIDGLRKKRVIYVRFPEEKENNANVLLIEKGAKAVDINGFLLNENVLSSLKKETPNEYETLIVQYLTSGPKTSKEILQKTKLSWSDAKMKKYLRQLSSIEEFKIKNKIYFRLKGSVLQPSFDFE